jgi:ABC-type uncharacterized transport system fused permease/ATPase subunit
MVSAIILQHPTHCNSNIANVFEHANTSTHSLYVQMHHRYFRYRFSLVIAQIVGDNSQNLVSKNWPAVFRGLSEFFLWTIPASFVNAALKWLTEKLSAMFRRRLSDRVHAQYIRGVNYYTVECLFVCLFVRCFCSCSS